MTDMEVQVKLMLEKKLENMLESYVNGKFLKKCELHHLQEMVKLAHQIRSLS